VSEPEEQRIAREESYWTAPRLFTAGLIFLAASIALLYAMASYSFAHTVG
jgi:hypothetical protein